MPDYTEILRLTTPVPVALLRAVLDHVEADDEVVVVASRPPVVIVRREAPVLPLS